MKDKTNKRNPENTPKAHHATAQYEHPAGTDRKRLLKIIALAAVAILLIAIGINTYRNRIRTGAEIMDTAYSDDVAKALEKNAGPPGNGETRPSYLPDSIFENLPPFPRDFYKVRSLIQSGRLVDFASLEEEYWQQPEFFPHFEDIGVPLLANPPEGRWGAYGIATYPADSVGSIAPEGSIEMVFFIKSNYLVETYQGVYLETVYKDSTAIESGFEMPDGTRTIKQNASRMKDHFTINVEPNPFVLYPNFPKYHLNGTRKVNVTITASSDTPPGNYVIGLDTAKVPYEYEQKWLREFLNLYTSGGMTKIDRPYFQAFVEVKGGEN